MLGLKFGNDINAYYIINYLLTTILLILILPSSDEELIITKYIHKIKDTVNLLSCDSKKICFTLTFAKTFFIHLSLSQHYINFKIFNIVSFSTSSFLLTNFY